MTNTNKQVFSDVNFSWLGLVSERILRRWAPNFSKCTGIVNEALPAAISFLSQFIKDALMCNALLKTVLHIVDKNVISTV